VTAAIDNRRARREAIPSESSSGESTKSKVGQDDATSKVYLFSGYHCVKMSLDPLHDLFRIHPKTAEIFSCDIRTANFEKEIGGIGSPLFQIKKQHVLIFYYFLEHTSGLDRDQFWTLADAVLKHRDEKAALPLLKAANLKVDKNILKAAQTLAKNAAINAQTLAKNATSNALGSNTKTGKSSKLTREEALWRDANNYASSVSDSSFLSMVDTALVDECLRDEAIQAKEAAYAYLRTRVESLVDETGRKIFKIQREDCDKQIQREITSEEDKELRGLRSEFVYKVLNSSQEHCRSYVYYSLGKWPIL
jgi:hypothetical protein